MDSSKPPDIELEGYLLPFARRRSLSTPRHSFRAARRNAAIGNQGKNPTPNRWHRLFARRRLYVENLYRLAEFFSSTVFLSRSDISR